MQKTRRTRKEKAAELLYRLKNGPSFSEPYNGPFTTELATEQFKRWSNSWIIGQLCELVPELKGK